MKSIGVTLQRTYLTKNCKITIVRDPAKLSNILDLTYLPMFNRGYCHFDFMFTIYRLAT